MTASHSDRRTRPSTPEGSETLGPVLRAAASALVLMTAAYYLVVAFDNITNPASYWAFVRGVLSQDGLVPDSGFQWRAVDATWFQVAGYVSIILVETVTGLLLAYASYRGFRSLKGAAEWAAAQRWTMVGTIAGLAVFFLGFITIGGNWFAMYLNSKFNGLDPAFQNAVMALLTALFVLAVVIAGRFRGDPAEVEVTTTRVDVVDLNRGETGPAGDRHPGLRPATDGGQHAIRRHQRLGLTRDIHASTNRPAAEEGNVTEIWMHGFPVPGEVVDLAIQLEEWGVDALLLADSEMLVGDPYIELALAARATSRLNWDPASRTRSPDMRQ